MPNEPVTTTTDSALGTSITNPTGPSGDVGTTPPALKGATRDGLKPGDVGYQGPPAPIPGDVSGTEESAPAPGDLGATHTIVTHETVGTLRRLMADVGRGTDGALDRFRAAFNRVF